METERTTGAAECLQAVGIKGRWLSSIKGPTGASTTSSSPVELETPGTIAIQMLRRGCENLLKTAQFTSFLYLIRGQEAVDQATSFVSEVLHPRLKAGIQAAAGAIGFANFTAPMQLPLIVQLIRAF